MSAPASPGSALPPSAVPVVNQTLAPAWVRKGSATTQKAYETALAFEEMLVEQLSQSLTASSGLGAEGGEGGEGGEGEAAASGGGAGGPLSSMLPQALTSGVMGAGGLGLAAQMTRELAGAAAAGASGADESGAGATATVAGGTSASVPVSAGSSSTTAPTNVAPTGSLATGGTSA